MKNRCVIITAYCNNSIRSFFNFRTDDFIICADAGYSLAKSEGIVPDVIIGDFDSAEMPKDSGIRVIVLPEMKDDTDTVACIRHALSLGCKEIVIIGGVGGRLDHTYANIQSLAFAYDKEAKCLLTDGDNEVTMLGGGEKVSLEKRQGWSLSVFSYSDKCEGVRESGVKYPLNGETITSAFPLGVSNEITADFAEISLDEGKLLIICSRL